jgi:hypothetical protein
MLNAAWNYQELARPKWNCMSKFSKLGGGMHVTSLDYEQNVKFQVGIIWTMASSLWGKN